jgi:hypothetical protein
MDIDVALKTVYENMPESMKVIRARDFNFESRVIVDMAHDPRNEAKRRLFLGLTFLRAALTLHRPYFLLGRTDPRYEYSRLVCLDAAMEMLEYQKRLEDEARPGGQLWSSKWRLWTVSWRQSSIVSQDFLLATTVLLSDLDKDISSPLPVSPANACRVRFKSGQPTRAEIIESLTAVYDIWSNQSERSRESKKVATALRYVLGKVSTHVGNSPGKFLCFVFHPARYKSLYPPISVLCNFQVLPPLRSLTYISFPGENETPPSQFDFADFAQKIPTDNFAHVNPDFSLFSVNNSEFGPPLQGTDSFLDVNAFDWVRFFLLLIIP